MPGILARFRMVQQLNCFAELKTIFPVNGGRNVIERSVVLMILKQRKCGQAEIEVRLRVLYLLDPLFSGQSELLHLHATDNEEGITPEWKSVA